MQTLLASVTIAHACLTPYALICCGIISTIHQILLTLWAYSCWKTMRHWQITTHLVLICLFVVGCISFSLSYLLLYAVQGGLFYLIVIRQKAFKEKGLGNGHGLIEPEEDDRERGISAVARELWQAASQANDSFARQRADR